MGGLGNQNSQDLMVRYKNLALVGNPNSGKSTIFNLLTGLSQKVGNFPGVTVESLEGHFKTFLGNQINLIDLPGSYSLYTNSKDELVLSQALLGGLNSVMPEGIIYVADLRYLHQQLLLLTQVLDLNYPTMIVLTNRDQVDEDLAERWTEFIHQKTACEVVSFSSRLGYTGILLKEKINLFLEQLSPHDQRKPIYEIPSSLTTQINQTKEKFKARSDYHALVLSLDPEFCQKNDLNSPDLPSIIRHQIAETMSRYSIIENWESQIKITTTTNDSERTKKLDRILTNPVWGLLIFFGIMFVVFQMMYSWAEFPMNAIEDLFAYTSSSLKQILPMDSWWSKLLTDGIIPGLAGVLVFIPQIFILFFMLSILEEAGYMTRVVYLLDHILSRFGLNGRSIIGLISGGACAIPAIMSTRSIYNKKERLISMFVIPLIPCSARIPVYTALIGFVVSSRKIYGIFNLQGLVFMSLYLIGIVAALLVAFLLHKIIPSEGRSFLIMQLPNYQIPPWRQVFTVVLLKVKSFVLQAGKVIMFISVGLWFLASFSWKGEFEKVERDFRSDPSYPSLTEKERAYKLESIQLEHSFAGKFGKWIEPIIEPLGFNWKIGISLITSFAAREVFVGTMSTIYSIGSDSDALKLREVLAAEKREDGTKFFNTRTAFSLIIFYAFALQCMSTMAVMRKETGNWKVPLLQFLFFGLLAYFSSMLVYHFLPST